MTTISSELQNVYCRSQGIYGASRSKIKTNYKKFGFRERDKSMSRSLSSNKLGFFIIQCPKPKNLVNNVNGLTLKDPRKTKRIL